jgi:hypothetical protein
MGNFHRLQEHHVWSDVTLQSLLCALWSKYYELRIRVVGDWLPSPAHSQPSTWSWGIHVLSYTLVADVGVQAQHVSHWSFEWSVCTATPFPSFVIPLLHVQLLHFLSPVICKDQLSSERAVSVFGSGPKTNIGSYCLGRFESLPSLVESGLGTW